MGSIWRFVIWGFPEEPRHSCPELWESNSAVIDVFLKKKTNRLVEFLIGTQYCEILVLSFLCVCLFFSFPFFLVFCCWLFEN